MSAQTVMRANFISLLPEHSALEATTLLVKHQLYAAPVVGADGQLHGVLSATDLISLILPGYLDEMKDLSFLPGSFELLAGPPAVTAAEICARQIQRQECFEGNNVPPVVEEEESLLEVARILVREGAWLCVVRRDGQVVGIIDPLDLLTTLLSRWQEEPTQP